MKNNSQNRKDVFKSVIFSYQTIYVLKMVAVILLISGTFLAVSSFIVLDSREDEKKITSNTTSKYKESYEIKYDANGGVGEPFTQSVNKKDNVVISEEIYTKEGSVFKGWAKRKNGKAVYKPGDVVTDIAGLSGEITLYAVWEDYKSYEIVYNSNGGTGSMDKSSYNYGESKPLLKNTFKKEGYTFIGWSTSQNKTALYEDEEIIENLLVTEKKNQKVNLYAVWKKKEKEVTIEKIVNGSLISENSTKKVKYGDSITFITTPDYPEEAYIIKEVKCSDKIESTYKEGEIVDYTKQDEIIITNNIDDIEKTTCSVTYELITYDVIYNSNGGKGTMENTTFNYGEGKNLSENKFTKKGYKFIGWTKNKDIEEATYFDEEYVSDLVVPSEKGEKITLYAVWEVNNYLINYNLDGGLATNPTSYNINTGTFILKNPVKEGYTFLGWTGTNLDKNTTSVSIPKGSTGNKKYTANWTANKYSIEYNSNGGTGKIENSMHIYDESKQLTKNTFTKKGYTFLGWSLDKNSDEIAYEDEENIVNLTSDSGGKVTLYAIWEANTYSAEYNSNNGIGFMENSTFTYDLSESLNENAFTKEGYTFLGWSLDKDAKEATYKDKEKVKNLTATSGETVTLYAVWEVNTYKIFYHANNGTGQMPSSDFKYDEQKKLSKNTFTKEGYTFKGWTTEKESNYVTYLEEEEVKNLTSDSGGKVNLYAVWEVNSYIIEYDSNGGTGSMPSSTFVYDTPKALSTNTFTKEGYTFKGWTLNPNKKVIAYSDKEKVKNLVSEDGGVLKLYAVWDVNNYKIKYNPNGGTGSMPSSSHTYKISKKLSKNTFVRKGYTFKGWSTNPNSTTVAYLEGATVKNLTTGKDDVNLYAVWQINEYSVDIVVQNGKTNSVSKKANYNMWPAFNITPSQDHTVASVDCTNNQRGQVINNVLYVIYLTDNTVCKVTYQDEVTTLYKDGTLIINEPAIKRESNKLKHGSVYKEYNALSEEESYVFENSKEVLWYNERDLIKQVEIGSKIKPLSTANWFNGCENLSSVNYTNLDTKDLFDISYMYNKAGTNSTLLKTKEVFTIPKGCNTTGFANSSKNFTGDLNIEDNIIYTDMFKNSAIGSNSRINLYYENKKSETIVDKLISLYGKSGSKSQGNIYKMN